MHSETYTYVGIILYTVSEYDKLDFHMSFEDIDIYDNLNREVLEEKIVEELGFDKKDFAIKIHFFSQYR